MKVDREYEGALTEVSDALADARGQKRKATGEALQVARGQAQARQSAWLQRASKLEAQGDIPQVCVSLVQER